MKQIMIDSSTTSTLILILKKSTQILTIKNGRKKLIDMHVVNKKKKKKKQKQKQRKYIDSYNREKKLLMCTL